MEWKNRNREQEPPKKSLVIGEQLGPNLSQLGFLPLIETPEESSEQPPLPPAKTQAHKEIDPRLFQSILDPGIVPLPDFTHPPSENAETSV